MPLGFGYDGADYTPEQVAYLKACEAYREEHHLKFFLALDYFRVMITLGYRLPPTDGPGEDES